jgi:diaminohydroxyphosphoribosylaminopyrimidine deaminase/5-amino-6-(5-phosphoribosylamino)uracil reductase
LFTAASADPGRTAALEARGIRVLRVPYVAGRLDLPSVFERLAAEGVQRVLCEGGGHVASSLLAADLVERMYLFYAPRVFGAGVEAFPSAEPFPAEKWRTVATRRHGQDVLLTLDRNRKA